VAAVADAVDDVRLASNQQLFAKGDVGTSMSVLVAGLVRMFGHNGVGGSLGLRGGGDYRPLDHHRAGRQRGGRGDVLASRSDWQPFFGNGRFPARWLPPMVFSTRLVLAVDTAHKRLRPEAPAATVASTARG